MRKQTCRLLSTVLSATTIMSMLTSVSAVATSDGDVANNADVALENVLQEQNLIDSQSSTTSQTNTNTEYYGYTGDRTLEQELPEDAVVISSASEYYKLTGKKYKVPSGSSLSASLPSSVDNSQSDYFPPIDNQGSIGSCVAWAQTYYQYTYTMNKALGVKTTKDNSFSPKWTYNMANCGLDNGSGSQDVYEIMKRQGNVHWSTLPYDEDYLSWSPYEEIWTEGMKYRIKSYEYFDEIGRKDSSLITSNDDEDLEPIKAALSSGEILTFSTCIYSWKGDKIKTNASVAESNKYSGQEVIVAQNGTDGGHRMTIVGYNDNIWTDINNNNQVDDGEMGALKIANSWGDGYANNGFVWLAYDALNAETVVAGAVNEQGRTTPTSQIARIEVRPYNAGTSLYLRYTLNTADRSQGVARIIAEKDGTVYSRTLYPSVMMTENGKFSFDGTKNANDGTMLYALDNLIPEVTSENFNDYTWSVKFGDKKADNTVFTAKNAEIVDLNKNVTYKTDNVYPIVFDGNEQTIEIVKTTVNNAVIYYRGYYAPNIHYKVGSGSWVSTAGIPMEENKERHGYTHKYVIKLNNQSQTTFYFSDDKGNIDNNNGNYYTAGKGVSYYVTENVATPLTVKLTNSFNSIADVDMCGRFLAEATGGYEPYEYKFVYQHIESGSETFRDYSEYETAGEYFRKVGDYKVTVYVKDFSDNVVSTSMFTTVKDFPFEISEFGVTPADKIMTGDELEFKAVTKYEHIRTWGGVYNQYNFTIKKGDEVCHKETKIAKTCSIGDMSSTVLLSWTPKYAGDYSITIDTTDNKKEYQEKTFNFTVKEFNGTIVGDADNNGKVNLTDALMVMKYNIGGLDESELWLRFSDVDDDGKANLKDVIYIMKYIVSGSDVANVGKVNYREIPTEPPTEAPTEKPTETPTETPTNPVNNNVVTFTNSFNWGGTMYCYYWSDTNKSMTSWPGKPMTKSGVNSSNQTLYTFEVPSEATYIIFTNSSMQTVDIPYGGGVVKYYPTTTDSKGHYKVQTWM